MQLQNDIVVLIALVLGMGLGGIVGGLLGNQFRRRPRRVEEETIKVKRTKPSLRNPLRTYDTKYDDFRTSRGLYEPVRPKSAPRPSKEDELEV